MESVEFREKQKDGTLNRIDFNLHNNGFSRLQDSVLDKIVKEVRSNNLAVSKPDKKLSIIEVRIQSTDERFAKEFDDEIVKTVNTFYVQTRTKKAFENLQILQHQTDSIRNVLNGVIYQSVAITDATPNLNPNRQTLRIPAIQKSQVNIEANKAILTQLVQNLELAKLSLRKETPLIQVIDEPILPLDKSKLGKLTAAIIGSIAAGFIVVIAFIFKSLFSN